MAFIKTRVNYYLTNYLSDYSMLNLTFVDEMTENDYVQFLITDNYSYRIDRIAKVVYPSQKNPEKYYIFILWASGITSIEDLKVGDNQETKILKCPTIDYINRFTAKYNLTNM